MDLEQAPLEEMRIAQTVWDAVRAFPIVSENFDEADLSLVARLVMTAILEEREACAQQADTIHRERKILERQERDDVNGSAEDVQILGGQAFIAKCIAAAIRWRG